MTPPAVVFLAGAQGSGTTLLLRLLAALPGWSSLGGNHVGVPEDDPEAVALAHEVEAANRAMWDRVVPLDGYRDARRRWSDAIAATRGSPRFAGQTHLLFKRSFPFGGEGGEHTPDLWDVVDTVPGVRLVAIYRDPRAATYSALRRGFDTDVRRLAVLCGGHLTWLAAQLAAVGPDRTHVLGYERLCRQPATELAAVARHCGVADPAAEAMVAAAALVETPDPSRNDRYRRELSGDDLAWVDAYFDARRRRQWALLDSSGPVGR